MKSENTPSPWRRPKYVGSVILIAYSLFLLYWGGRPMPAGEAAKTAFGQSQDGWRSVGCIEGLVLRASCDFAYFVPIGFVVALVVSRGSRHPRRVGTGLRATAIASAIAVVLYAIRLARSGHLAAAPGVVFPLLGCLFGSWAGNAWLGGRRTRLWFLPKVAALILLAALSTRGLEQLLLEDISLPLEAARVTSSEKRRLVHLIDGESRASLERDQAHTLKLTAHDVNALLAWALSFATSERKAMISLDRGSISLKSSMAVSPGRGRRRYLNLEATGVAGVEEGILSLRVNRARIGRAAIPRPLLRCLCPLVGALLSYDQRVKPFLEATRRVAIEPDSIQITYDALDIPSELRRNLFRPAIVDNELLVSTRIQAEHLLLLLGAGPMPDFQPTFKLCLTTSFALARDRSVQRSPIAENQAAILALGMLLGHPRIERFVGPVIADRDRDLARQVLNRVILRGRRDWARHFCVSAAITALSDEAVSDIASLLKERLDTKEGGSGFSFADLLADRAGAAFAASATRDEAAARAMQDRLAHSFHTNELFPPAADLPEGISDAELHSTYGGVGGDGYRRLIEEIERRITACAAYQ